MLVLNSIFALGCVSRKTQNWEPALGQTAAPPNSSREGGKWRAFYVVNWDELTPLSRL